MQKELSNTPGNPSDNEENYPPYQIESNVYRHAKMELDILLKTYPTRDNPPIVKDFIHEILALVNKFGHSGQSGGSAPFTAEAIASTVKKLCLFQPLGDITGHDDEWADVGLEGNGLSAQNKRLSSVFKLPDGKFKYLDAIVWKNQHGATWTGTAQLSDGTHIRNQAYIKSFPFKPKTFTIDVIEEEVAKDDWTFHVKDEKQLDEVWAYYDKIILDK